jgi:hypothetical protein
VLDFDFTFVFKAAQLMSQVTEKYEHHYFSEHTPKPVPS